MANKKEEGGRADPVKLSPDEKLLIEKIKRGLKIVDAMKANNNVKV